MKDLYASLWLAWIGMFVIIEGSALVIRHPQFTLSEYVWRVEQLGQPWTVVRYLVAAFCLWLALHMTFGILR